MPDLNYKIAKGEVLTPNTKGVRGIYKEPLSIVKKGFGYRGVLIRNVENTHLQCHICGYFFKSLGVHAAKAHGIKRQEYRHTFGLLSTTPLVAGETRTMYRRKSWDSLSKAEKQIRIDNLKKGRKIKARRGYRTARLEEYNKRGTCPEQLIDRLNKLFKLLGRTPTSREFMRHYKAGLYSVTLQYGSYLNMVQIAGLPKPRSPWYDRKLND